MRSSCHAARSGGAILSPIGGGRVRDVAAVGDLGYRSMPAPTKEVLLPLLSPDDTSERERGGVGYDAESFINRKPSP
jgi:hypothetical protein